MEPQDEQDETILEKYGLYMGIVGGLLLVCIGLVAFFDHVAGSTSEH